MLSHMDENDQPRIVDVSGKAVTERTARARAIVSLPASVAAAFVDGELQTRKGPVIQTAIIAGVMAAKRTSELIPLCHPVGLEDCRIRIDWNEAHELLIDCTTTVHHKTGVEMEALTGASVAALTVYDMCKSMSHEIVIKEVRLVSKRGGKCDFELRP